jgi:hypothetical protein
MDPDLHRDDDSLLVPASREFRHPGAGRGPGSLQNQL